MADSRRTDRAVRWWSSWSFSSWPPFCFCYDVFWVQIFKEIAGHPYLSVHNRSPQGLTTRSVKLIQEPTGLSGQPPDDPTSPPGEPRRGCPVVSVRSRRRISHWPMRSRRGPQNRGDAEPSRRTQSCGNRAAGNRAAECEPAGDWAASLRRGSLRRGRNLPTSSRPTRPCSRSKRLRRAMTEVRKRVVHPQGAEQPRGVDPRGAACGGWPSPGLDQYFRRRDRADREGHGVQRRARRGSSSGSCTRLHRRPHGDQRRHLVPGPRDAGDRRFHRRGGPSHAHAAARSRADLSDKRRERREWRSR